MIKGGLLESNNALSDNFKNKREITSAIKPIQLSPKTVMRQVVIMTLMLFYILNYISISAITFH